MTEEVEQRYLMQKIESIETRLENHVTKIEQRLDQIVTIMQAVATLQEKESRNSESIKEVRIQLKESIDKWDKSITRIHDRLDVFDVAVNDDKKAFDETNRTLKDEIKAVDDKVSKWMNRGIGLWIGISALVVILQTIGGVFLTSFKDEYQAQKVQINEISKRQNETEQDIGRLGNTFRQYHDRYHPDK